MLTFLLFNKVFNRPPPWRRDWNARHWWSHYPPHPLYDCYIKNPGKPRKLYRLFPTFFLSWSSCGSASLNRDPNWLTDSLTDSHTVSFNGLFPTSLNLFQLLPTSINFYQHVSTSFNLYQPLPSSVNLCQPYSISVILSESQLNKANLVGSK